jgi:hypothetical protein
VESKLPNEQVALPSEYEAVKAAVFEDLEKRALART